LRWPRVRERPGLPQPVLHAARRPAARAARVRARSLRGGRQPVRCGAPGGGWLPGARPRGPRRTAAARGRRAPVSERVLLAWSSGKDSAFSLHVLREQGVAVTGLLTTINDALDRARGRA